MAANRIYSFSDASTYPPAAFLNLTFNIPANNRELKIKSITVQRAQRQAPGGAWIPNEACLDIVPVLWVGPGVPGSEITRMFNFTLGSPQFNGTSFAIVDNCNLQFNSFTIMNNLPFTLTINNVGPNIIQVYFSLFVEVEEHIIWQGPPAESYHVTE